jgi:alpha-beta hydrolase superfamily lysophospholipase
MRLIVKFILAVAVIIACLSFTFPRDRVDRNVSFDAARLPDDLDAYLATSEAAFADITDGSAKRIVWAGAVGAKTPLAIVYVHGFSATAAEIRPVPDNVAKATGANLYFMRLAGHGQSGDALAQATAGDWVEDLAEAMAIGRRLGDRVVLMSTSTGSPLAAIAATDAGLTDALAGVVMISPNFGLKSAAGMILDMPLARWWGPVVAGATRSFEPVNDQHAAHWTHTYPTTALFPMAALVREGRGVDFSLATVPLLLIYAEADQVIDPARIPAVAGAWGGPVTEEKMVLGAGDDPYSHVIAGDILSPGQTARATKVILDWMGANGL